MIDFHIVKLQGEEVRIFKTLSPFRVEGETHYEYRARRKFLKDEVYRIKKGVGYEKRLKDRE
jgi:hypothetical protein